MPTLPQLFQEDVTVLDRALDQLLRNTEATTAIVIDKGGFLITQCGDTGSVDTIANHNATTLGFECDTTIVECEADRREPEHLEPACCEFAVGSCRVGEHRLDEFVAFEHADVAADAGADVETHRTPNDESTGRSGCSTEMGSRASSTYPSA